uniref:Pao retrotransposon peptidase n=1 Tax=Loa loa TaxID=7209 RepID=A0A1I7W3P8_LOALO
MNFFRTYKKHSADEFTTDSKGTALVAKHVNKATYRLAVPLSTLTGRGQDNPNPLLQNEEVWRSPIKKWSTDVTEMPRVAINSTKLMQIHVFTDASNVAYATATYVLNSNAIKVEISLIFAKSRLAPIKGMSIPRLEMLAILIGVRAEYELWWNEPQWLREPETKWPQWEYQTVKGYENGTEGRIITKVTT